MAGNRVTRIFSYFWTKESGLTSMLVLLCLVNFVIVPVFGDNLMVRIVTNLFWMLFIFAGIVSVAKSRRQVFLLSIIPVLFIIFRWIMVFDHEASIRYITFLLGMIVISLLIGLIFVKVFFDEGPVNIHRIVGAIVIYILMGSMFSEIFSFLFVEFPGSFNLLLSGNNFNSVHALFIYFSFTTLTTTGFGDIIPAGTMTRNLVVIEQLIGVLYPVIMIGRLVSLGIINKTK